MVVSCNSANLYRKESSNYGASWGSWVQMANARPCERGAAVTFKSNGDCIIVHASDVNDPNSLYIQKRVSGSWSSGLGQRSGDRAIEGLAAYHDGDWNIVAMVIEGNYLVLNRMVYGDGDRVTSEVWTDDIKMDLARARLDFSAQMQLRRFESQYMFGGQSRRTPTWWEKHHTVIEALAGEGLDLAGVSITKPSSYPALFSTARSNTPWLFRMKPGTDFFDSWWTKASFIQNCRAKYGMAISCDSSYIWATQANEVWRSALPSFWEAPSAGDGAGDTVTLPASRILAVHEDIRPTRYQISLSSWTTPTEHLIPLAAATMPSLRGEPGSTFTSAIKHQSERTQKNADVTSLNLTSTTALLTVHYSLFTVLMPGVSWRGTSLISRWSGTWIQRTILYMVLLILSWELSMLPWTIRAAALLSLHCTPKSAYMPGSPPPA